MNYNLLSYAVYGCMMIYIIYYVGKAFHQNGRIFILRLFRGNEPLTDTTNNILLMAYYLFNIGYAVVQFSYWERVEGMATLISSVCFKAGVLVLILAITHYCNMLLIYFLSKRTSSLIITKK